MVHAGVAVRLPLRFCGSSSVQLWLRQEPEAAWNAAPW